MKRISLLSLLVLFTLSLFSANKKNDKISDREFTANLAYQIAEPVLVYILPRGDWRRRSMLSMLRFFCWAKSCAYWRAKVGMMRAERSWKERSNTSARPIIEQASNNHIGQPAAWIMLNTRFPLDLATIKVYFNVNVHTE